MAVSLTYKVLWGTGVFLIISPHLNQGLLSDYKICGDSACESAMSRVLAIRDHHGKDCRFLSFRRGDTIFVYHKLTGKREDLWAGSIDKQFGYFPKDAVKEEEVHATVEKVLETQGSDFFCMDEYGYLIDSSHLDNDEDDERIQNQESETIQTTNMDNKNVESALTDEVVSSEVTLSPLEADITLTEEDTNKNTSDSSSDTHKETQEDSAASDEKGGSASPSWVGSSVTGWFSLSKEEETASLTEREQNDEKQEAPTTNSLTDSITGLLRLGGDGKPDDAEKDRETGDSLAATMTGWLGFGGEQNKDPPAEQEQNEEKEKDDEQEPAQTFRSRRMSLDLEGNHLHKDEKKEMGTFDWLENGLSNTLGFGLTSQESGHETTPEKEVGGTIHSEQEQPAASSWFGVPFRNILGVRKDGSEAEEKDEITEQQTGSEIVDESQSQEDREMQTNYDSQVEDMSKNKDVPFETESDPPTSDGNNTDSDTSERSEDSFLPEDAASSSTFLEEKSQTAGETSSVLNSYSQKGSEGEDEDHSLNDNNKEKNLFNGGTEDSDHQTPKSDENVNKENKKETEEEEEMNTAGDTEQTSMTQSDFSSVDLNSNSMETSVDEADTTEEKVEEKTQIPDPADTGEQTHESFETTVSDSDGFGSDSNRGGTDAFQRSAQTEEQNQVSGGADESSGESQPTSSSATAEKINEAVSDQGATSTIYSEGTDADLSDSQDRATEAETQDESGQGEEEKSPAELSPPGFGSSLSMNGSTQTTPENDAEEDGRAFSTSESTTQIENVADSASLHRQHNGGEAHMQKEREEDSRAEPDPIQEAEFDRHVLNDNGIHSAIGSETQTDEVEDPAEKEVQEEREVLQDDEEQQDVQEEELDEQGKLNTEEEATSLQNQQEMEQEEHDVEPKLNTEDEAKDVANQQGIQEEERDEEGELKTEEEATASENQQGMEEEMATQDEVEEEVKVLERQQDVVEKKQDEAELLKENEQHREEEKIEEGKQEETEMEIKMEKETEAVEFEEEKERKGAEDQEEINKEDSKEEEQNSEMMMRKDHEKQEEIGKLKGEERQEIEGEVKQDEIQEAVEEYKEGEKQEDTIGVEEEKQGEEIKEAQEEEEEKEVDEQLQIQSSAEKENSLHMNKPETESNRRETQDENSLDPGFSTQMEKFQTKEMSIQEDSNTQVVAKDEKLEEEEAEQKSEDERGDGKDTDGTLRCSNHLCTDTSDGDGFISSTDGITSVDRLSPADDGETERGSQNLLVDNDHMSTDRTGTGQAVPSEGMEEEQGRKQEEEERSDDAEADDGNEEPGENKQSESNVTGSEAISDLKNDSTDNDPPYSVESVQNNLLHQITLDQAPQSKEDDVLYSSEAKNINFSDDSALSQTEDTDSQSKDVSFENETGQIQSVDMTDTTETTDTEERELKVNEDDVRVIGDVHHTAGTESGTEGGVEHLVSSSESIEGQTASPVSQHPAGSDASAATAETQNGGAFGLLRNAFSIFGQKPAAKSIESAPSLDDDTGEIAEAETSQTPQQELDSTTESTQVLQPASTLPQEQVQPSPTPPPLTQTASPSPVQTHLHPTTPSPNTKSSLQVKNFSKQYKSLLVYLSMDETVVLIELFGRHKLQFLDYILGSSETMTDYDESILLDIERLLHYHRDKLVALGKTVAGTLEEDSETTRALVALQKLETLLSRMLETFNAGKSDTSNANRQAIDSSVDSSEDEKRGGERVSAESSNSRSPESTEALEALKQILDFAHQIAEDSATHARAAMELLIWLSVQVVSSLPDDIRPGPDLYGVPWEPVIISSVLGLVTILMFTCRCYSSVKSRMYRSKEQWMAEQIARMLDEKCQVLEDLSKCQKEHDALEDSLRDSGVLAQSQTTEHLEDKVTQLGRAKKELERDLEQLKDQLEQQREHRREQEKRITMLEDSMKTLEEETKDLQSQDEQAQTTLKVYSMSSDRLQRNLETAGEENTLLQESNAQLRQQVEGWAERVSELEAEMSRFEVAHSAMLQDVANKDERILSLTDRLLGMKAWDSDLAEEEDKEEGDEASNGTAGRRAENGGDSERHLQKVQKLIYAAKLNADLKSVDEDKDRVFAKLNDEVKAKEDLLVSIKELENEKLSLQSDSENYSEQVQRLQQKLHIMTEMYQENELKLHRLLTVEEKERLQKEEKLNKADKNIALAIEELNNYRQRAAEMEEELEKTKQSYQTQISAHEKKAHNNWLAARAADRELTDIRRENSLLRQKLTDTQFKLDTLDKDPYALDNLARPLPFRAERSPYGPSPLGRPASETRAFLSPPTLMDGPPARLSPRVPRGPGEPLGGHGEMERSGGPHSDSGSISPTWERDRRGPPPGPPGPLGPQGYMFPEPGGPMFRRPPPPPGVLGHLPPPGPLHPRGLPPGPPHPADIADGAYRENSLGPGEQELRESGPGERRTPPESDPRMGSLPPPGPPMGPLDGPFPRRAPYGPPPPDFFPPRGPGGPPPMMPMWGPPRPGMMFPPRLPPGGPPLPPHPLHAPPMRGPLPDGLPPFASGPPPPQQSPEEHTPSPEDAI